MPPSDNATYAAYFIYGLEAGVVTMEDAKSWAFSIVEREDEPSSEIIEVAMSRGKEQIFSTLKTISGGADTSLAGTWLLGLLKERLKNNPEGFQSICRKAMQIARSTKQPDDIYYELDGIDDEIYLAKINTYGSLDDCRQHLVEALEPYHAIAEIRKT